MKTIHWRAICDIWNSYNTGTFKEIKYSKRNFCLAVLENCQSLEPCSVFYYLW